METGIRKYTPKEVFEASGYATMDNLLNAAFTNDKTFACCSGMCKVELDGDCEHGFPAITKELNMV